ncbi:MAG TPA: hypothetical protein VGM78_00085, partial [Ilumatobacteraceae bacterium]
SEPSETIDAFRNDGSGGLNLVKSEPTDWHMNAYADAPDHPVLTPTGLDIPSLGTVMSIDTGVVDDDAVTINRITLDDDSVRATVIRGTPPGTAWTLSYNGYSADGAIPEWLAEPFGSGAWYFDHTQNDSDDGAFIALLSPSANNSWFRLGPWAFGGADDQQIIVTQVTSAGLEIAALAPPAAPAPTTATTTAATTSGGALTQTAWLAGQIAAGATAASVNAADGYPASLVTVSESQSTTEHSAIVLADGTVMTVPASVDVKPASLAALVGVGHQLALFVRADNDLTAWLLDPVTGNWTEGPDLGLGPISGQSLLTIRDVGGSVLIGDALFTDDSGVPSSQAGAVLAPDLSVTKVAQPPAGALMTWTAVSGSTALLLGEDTIAAEFAGHDASLHHPWSYDVRTNTWSVIANPSWLDCGPSGNGCSWEEAHDYGDSHLEAATTSGAVVLLSDRSLGLYDPIGGGWTRLDNTPFVPQLISSAELDNGSLAVFPGDAMPTPTQFGTVGVLDL